MPARLHTISDLHKRYQTAGSSPIQFLCDDFEEYVCKYGRQTHLINEFLAASFCEIWKVPVPEFRVVEVRENHIPPSFSKHLFEIPCFGSNFLSQAIDISEIQKTWVKHDYQRSGFVMVDLIRTVFSQK